MVDIKAIFNFIAKNPPSILILGGILFILLGALMIPINHEGSMILLGWAPWLIGLGVLLQILWLFLHRK